MSPRNWKFALLSLDTEVNPAGNEQRKIGQSAQEVGAHRVDGADDDGSGTVGVVEGGHDLKVHGNIVDHEYEIECDGDKVAEVSKRWFRVRDTYGIEIAPDQHDALLLAVAVCLDQMSHDHG